MVTTTTKTLNYSIIRGNHTNSVNATITSTPGFNINYFGKIPGILKVIELITLIVALGLAASRRREGNHYNSTNPSIDSWKIEYFLTGEVFFLCVMTAGLIWLVSILITYAIHIVSSVIIPKTTIHEVVFNFMFMLLFWVAGIVLLAETVPNAYSYNNRGDMTQGDWGCRIAAGILTVIALGLAASRRREGGTNIVGWPIEYFLVGEVFFLCICSAGLTYLFGQLTTFLWSVTSSVLIPKTTYFEIVINLILGLCWITAGIVELCKTTGEGWNDWPMTNQDWGCRIAAGIMVVVALALVASLRDERRLVSNLTLNGSTYESFPREIWLSGETYFLCVHTLALGVLMIILLSYAFHTVSSMIVPKASTVENWMNMILGILLLIAGIVELVQTENWKVHPTNGKPLMTDSEYGTRLAAGIIALLTGIMFMISFALSYRELQGPKPV